MSTTADPSALEQFEQLVREVAEMVRAMPESEARTVHEFAAFITAKLAKEEEEWDRLCASKADSPKLRAMIEQVDRDIEEGKTQPLDFDRL